MISLSRLLPPWAGRAALLVLGAAAVLAFSASYIVKERESALVLRFGRAVEVRLEPGWFAKWPWPLERVVRVDLRLKHGEIRLSETLTKDKRNVIVPMFYAWRVADPARYLAAVGTESAAVEKLDAMITSARNATLGRHGFEQLVSVQADQAILSRLEQEITARAGADARQHLGLELATTGILQINLPQANTESVFMRMRAERRREATQYRAEGRSQAETIKAETDKESSIQLAEAKRAAEEMRGRAEAEAAAIYARAHGQDIAFYAFLRELQSLRSVVDRNSTLVLGTDLPPFSLLKRGPEGAFTGDSRSRPATQPALPWLNPTAADPAVHPMAMSPLVLDPPRPPASR